MSEDHIVDTINAMGYVTCKPRQIVPSYYKINDGTGTILRVLITVNHLTPRAGREGNFDVNSSIQVGAFVPANSRTQASFVPHTAADTASTIAVRDVDYEVLREGFSVYSMSNGLTMSVKTAMGQIDKTKLVSPHGEPIYIVNPIPVTKIRHDGP